MSRKVKILLLLVFLILISTMFLIAYDVIKLSFLDPVTADNVQKFINENIVVYFDPINFIKSYGDYIIKTITLIIIFYILYKIINIIFDVFFNMGRRAATIGKLTKSVINLGLLIAFIFVVLTTWGVPAGTLTAVMITALAAIGIAAKDLVSDMLSGIFNVVEDQFAVGDIVEIDGFRGRVVEIGVRSIRIQNWKGDIKIIRNASFDSMLNYSKVLSTAICDISIAYEEDVAKAERVIKAISPRLKQKYQAIQEGPFYLGVEELGSSDVVLRIIAKTNEKDRFQVERDLNRELKAAFDRNKINIPFPQLVIHKGDDQEHEDLDQVIGLSSSKKGKTASQKKVENTMRKYGGADDADSGEE